ncbi:MAG: N-acetyltransferase family protein [Planctomycetota bacterium]
MATDRPNIVLRMAGPDDAAILCEMVGELAAYEHASERNACTEEVLREELQPDHVLKGVLAFRDGEPAGMATFFQTFSTFAGRRGIYLEDIYVKERFRHQGIGSRLLRFVAQAALDWDCSRVEWTSLLWNSTAMEFYESLGARPNDAWTTFRLDGEWLRRQAERSRRESTGA